MLHVASKSIAAQELDLGSSEAKIARRGMVPSKGLESKASPHKNWTWVASGTKFDSKFLCGATPVTRFEAWGPDAGKTLPHERSRQPDRASQPGRARGARGSQIEPARASPGARGCQIEPARASQGAQGSQIEPARAPRSTRVPQLGRLRWVISL